MIGLGTVVNAAAIVAGGLLGLACKRLISERLQDALIKATGVCVLFLGTAGALAEMLAVSDGKLSVSGSRMLILSCALGALVGEWIDIEGAFERLGVRLRAAAHAQGDARFLDGFLTASLTVCIGAMAIVGAIRDGLLRDPSLLIAKAILDFIIVLVMSASMGKGCLFSAVPVALLQGTVTALAGLLSPVMTDAAISGISLVGSVLIFCVGVNLVWGKRIRVANLLPAIVFAAAFSFI